MDRDEMLRLFEAHREAEAARDIDAILETFVADPFLETIPLGLRSEGRDAVRAAYEAQFFTAFPDLAPVDEGMAFGDDVIAVWGPCAEPAGGIGSGFSLQEGAASRCPSPTSCPSARDGWPARRSTSTSPRCVSKRGSRSRRFGRPRPRDEGPDSFGAGLTHALSIDQRTLLPGRRPSPRADQRHGDDDGSSDHLSQQAIGQCRRMPSAAVAIPSRSITGSTPGTTPAQIETGVSSPPSTAASRRSLAQVDPRRRFWAIGRIDDTPTVGGEEGGLLHHHDGRGPASGQRFLVEFLGTRGPVAAPPQVSDGCSGSPDPLTESRGGGGIDPRTVSDQGVLERGSPRHDQVKRVGRGGLEPPTCRL